MTPILYSAGTTEFTSLGLGMLGDCISCSVVEERNGAYELAMQYPVSGQRFDDLLLNNIIYARPAYKKDPEPFRIYRITKPMSGVVTVYAEHVSYQLCHIPVKLFTAQSCAGALQAIKSNSIESNPFTFWTDKTVNRAFKNETPTSARSLLGGVKGSILDVYGGEFEFTGWTVKLHASRGADNGVTIDYGKNLTDFNQEESIAEVITGVSPIWKNSDGVVVRGNTRYCSEELRTKYPYNRTAVIDFSSDFESKPTVAQLTERAEQYIADNQIGKPVVSLTVSFVTLEDTEEYKGFGRLETVNLCDYVTVNFPYLGVSVISKIVKTDFDVMHDRYNSVEIGSQTFTLAQTLATVESDAQIDIQTTQEQLERAIDSATAAINGVNGGYVTIRSNAAGEPQEILIMDTNNVETASKVWRWNVNGLGYSGTGINGPYTAAITQDGAIVADFITVGTLTANLIKAGVLSDAAGKYTLDLATGTVTMKNANITGGSIKIQSASTATSIIELNSGNTKSSFMPSGMKMVNSLNESSVTADWANFKSSNNNINTTVTAEGVTLRNGDINTVAYSTFGTHIDDPDNGSKANTDYVDIRNNGVHVGTHKTNGSLNNMANLVPDQLGFKTQEGEQRAIYPAMSTLITNLDTELNTGIFRFDSDAVGNPLGANQGLMFAIRYGANSGFQLVTSNRGGTTNRRKMMIRHRYSGAWTPWCTINSSITPIGTMHEATPSSERMALAFPTATWDTACYVDLEEGVWEVKAKARWATNAVGDRRLYVGTLSNGTQQMCNEDACQNARTTTGTSTFITNSGTSTVRVYLRVYQTSGSSIMLDGSSNADFNGIRAVKIGEVQS